MSEIHIHSLEQFDDIIDNFNALVIFYSSHCKACSYIHDEIGVFKDEEGVVVAMVDIDKNIDTYKDNNISALPTFVLFVDGSEKYRGIGNIPLNIINTEIKKCLP